MGTVVLYTSHYGATARYARELAATLDMPCFELGKEDSYVVKNAQRIIYGGGLYAGNVAGLARAKRYFAGKEVYIFAVGIMQAGGPDICAHVEQQLQRCLGSGNAPAPGHLFCLNGAFCFARLNIVHKSMVRMMRRMLLGKGDALTREERSLLDALDAPVDLVDITTLAPLIAACGAGK